MWSKGCVAQSLPARIAAYRNRPVIGQSRRAAFSRAPGHARRRWGGIAVADRDEFVADEKVGEGAERIL
jgi:hypothetical protein